MDQADDAARVLAGRIAEVLPIEDPLWRSYRLVP
jgi:hypothetical protein